MAEDKKPPGTVAVGQQDGKVIMTIEGVPGAIAMNAAQAMTMANAVYKTATELDTKLINEQLQKDDEMLVMFARMLFAAAGMYLTRKSIVGIADHNESIGLATRLLVGEAERATNGRKDRTNGKPKER